MSTRVHIVVPDEVLRRVDEARGDVPRSRFVLRALEKALGGVAASGFDSGLGPVAGSVPVRPASSRASEVEGLKNIAESLRVPGVVRGSSLVKQGVRPVPKRGEK